jgi:hypothetical protein
MDFGIRFLVFGVLDIGRADLCLGAGVCVL